MHVLLAPILALVILAPLLVLLAPVLVNINDYRHTTFALIVFVISLCINDLCTLFFVVLVIIDSYVWRRWRAGDVMCRLNPELTVAFTGCTLWHTALIAIHR